MGTFILNQPTGRLVTASYEVSRQWSPEYYAKMNLNYNYFAKDVTGLAISVYPGV